MVQIKKIKVNFKRDGIKMDTDRNEFALALKTYRLRTGKTQRDLAQEWGTSRYTIMRAEAAKDISWMQAYKLFSHLAKDLEQEQRCDTLH